MYSFARTVNKVRSNNVTRWFHTLRDGDVTPAQLVQGISDRFIDILKSYNNISLAVPERVFRTVMCEAICVMKFMSNKNYELPIPQRFFPHPDGWNNDLEGWWTEWLYSHFFVDKFWYRFWSDIYLSDLEIDLPLLRETIQNLLPFYIQRNTDVLVECGFIIESDDGVFVANDDYEYDAPLEYDIYYS